MERRRLELNSIFEEILGNENVYFQPPENIHMNYPAIVYHRAQIEPQFANNGVYLTRVAYKVTVIDPSPEGVIAGKVSKLPSCVHNQHFKKDNLNQDVFTLY